MLQIHSNWAIAVLFMYGVLVSCSAAMTNESSLSTNEENNVVNMEAFEELEPNDEARLVKRMIERYKGFGLARPVAEVEKTLNVSLLFFINEFLGVDEMTGTMKVTATIVAQWQDDLLRWNPGHFNNLKAIPMMTKYVFLPTIVKDGNGGTQASIFMTGSGQNDRDINSMVWVHHTGLVEAKVINNYLTSCKVIYIYSSI